MSQRFVIASDAKGTVAQRFIDRFQCVLVPSDTSLPIGEEHEEVGAILAMLRRAAADYVASDWACTSYRTLMKELDVMEADTLEHVHLENHVLLPRYSS